MDWGNAAEFDLVQSTFVSGVSDTTQKMEGIIRGISQQYNYTNQASTTAFSASIMRGLMKENWTRSNGDVATDIFVGAYLSDKIDSFANKSTIVVTGVGAKEVINAVDVFETGLGRVRKHTHRYIPSTSGSPEGSPSGIEGTPILAVRPEKLKIAYLQRPFIDMGLARSGDYEKRAIVGKLTLELLNKYSNWYADGYSTA